MKILVTGAAGFIASYLIPRLLDEGAEVVGFDIVKEPILLKPVLGRIEYLAGDLSNPGDLYKAVLGRKVTHIIHLGSILAGPCDENPARGFRINFDSTLTLLDAALQAGVQRVVMTSTIAVFGAGLALPVADDAVKNPANIYGQTKLAGEHLLRWYQEKRGLSTGAVRFPWVFGPGRETGITALYSSKLLDAVALGKPLVIDNPDERGDWLYVKDAVASLLLMLRLQRTPQTVYNIMGGCHSIREVMEIARKFRPRAVISYGSGPKSDNPYPAEFDDSAARRDIGWKPSYPIEKAVRDHIETVEKAAAPVPAQL